MKWDKYVLKTTTAAVDLISVMLMDNGVNGVEISDNVPLTEHDKEQMFVDILPDLPNDDGTAYLTFYTEEGDEEVIKNVKEGLKELADSVDIGSGSITRSVTEDVDWINNWKQFFKAFSVDDIVIKPTWEEYKPEYDGKITIDIDPGIAFGTGMHETTQLCIRQLKKYVKGGERILDAGCGSGILSIVSSKLNAGSCKCVDIDEYATKATEENMAVNKVDKNFYEVFTGNIINDKSLQAKIGNESCDIVVANILADVIIPLTPIALDVLRPGGVFITSGIINTKEDEVSETIRNTEGFEILEITRQKDWSCIVAKKNI